MAARWMLLGLGLGLALALACDGTPLPSEGSRFETLRSWDTQLLADGHPRPEWVVRDGDLPSDTLSVTLVARGDPQAWMAFEVRDMAAQLLVDPKMSESSPNRALPSRGVTVAMLPSASATIDLSRNFQVTAQLLQLYAGITLPRIDVFLKRPRKAGGGTPLVQDLPIAVVVVGEHRPSEANLADTLEQLTDIWARAGVQIRVLPLVQRTDLTFVRYERLLLDTALGSNSPELAGLLALSAQIPEISDMDRPLVLFLVADIITGPGMAVWAVAGGVPVPPLLGTGRSGLAVNVQVVDADPARAAQVLAHEIGHALGLFHTTEARLVRAKLTAVPAAVHDQLDDTPACPPEADRNADSVLSADECQDWDSRNLMFWAGVRVSTGLTRGQGDIARRSALTR
jgi:hypothetical protein